MCIYIYIYMYVYIMYVFQAAANVAKRLIPLFDRVLVQRAEAITKTKGGIVLPEKAQAKVLRGTVVAAGPGARNDVRLVSFIIYISLYLTKYSYIPAFGNKCVFSSFRKESMCL